MCACGDKGVFCLFVGICGYSGKEVCGMFVLSGKMFCFISREMECNNQFEVRNIVNQTT